MFKKLRDPLQKRGILLLADIAHYVQICVDSLSSDFPNGDATTHYYLIQRLHKDLHDLLAKYIQPPEASM